jgi:F0F1-type ATP synthase assembly protein I
VFPQMPNPREMGRYLALSQIGVEMAAPVVVGVLLDRYFGFGPWGAIGGAVLGLVGGLIHLVHLANKMEGGDADKDRPSPGKK